MHTFIYSSGFNLKFNIRSASNIFTGVLHSLSLPKYQVVQFHTRNGSVHLSGFKFIRSSSNIFTGVLHTLSLSKYQVVQFHTRNGSRSRQRGITLGQDIRHPVLSCPKLCDERWLVIWLLQCIAADEYQLYCSTDCCSLHMPCMFPWYHKLQSAV